MSELELSYQVVVNREEQFSIWPLNRDLPAGWSAEGTTGTRRRCLDRINEIWVDMRPLSLRRAMSEEPAR